MTYGKHKGAENTNVSATEYDFRFPGPDIFSDSLHKLGPKSMATVSYIIKWIRCDDSGTTWTIHGIDQQGVFYGEWINWKTLNGGSIEGQLASHDNIRLHEMLVNLEISIQSESLQDDSGSLAPGDTHNGLIGRGAYSAPSIMLRYRLGDESNRPAAALFRQIVQLMDPILDQNVI